VTDFLLPSPLQRGRQYALLAQKSGDNVAAVCCPLLPQAILPGNLAWTGIRKRRHSHHLTQSPPYTI
jgi:hypothetical protein